MKIHYSDWRVRAICKQCGHVLTTYVSFGDVWFVNNNFPICPVCAVHSPAVRQDYRHKIVTHGNWWNPFKYRAYKSVEVK